MDLSKYQELAMRTNDGKCTERLKNNLIDDVFRNLKTGDILNACLGLSGEVGEVNDTIKKWIFHGHTLEKDEVKKEIGDIMWYVALICHGLNVDLEEISQMNIEKLKKRYPEGFSEWDSIHRKE